MGLNLGFNGWVILVPEAQWMEGSWEAARRGESGMMDKWNPKNTEEIFMLGRHDWDYLWLIYG